MSLLVLPEGVLFARRYQIIRCVAMGGMGAVYEVVHVETDRRRALKVLLPSFLHNADMRHRFRQEARVTARIQSEYIVDVLDAGIDEATQMPFLVMELLTGEELDKRVARLGALQPEDVVTYIFQASLALDKTHGAAIVHRDLKPGNLFLTEREDGSPRIKVLDFGIAKLVAEGATGPASQILGTPLYMAPEQFQLGLKASPAADIFALGMIAYTLLAGKPYWSEEASMAANIYAFIAAVVGGPAEPATARAKRQGVYLPPAFDAWFAKVAALAPRDRFPTASSAAFALGDVFGVALAPRSSAGGSIEPRIPPSAPAAERRSSLEVSPTGRRPSEAGLERPIYPNAAPARSSSMATEAAAPGMGLASTAPVEPRRAGVVATVITMALVSAVVSGGVALAILWNRGADNPKIDAAAVAAASSVMPAASSASAGEPSIMPRGAPPAAVVSAPVAPTLVVPADSTPINSTAKVSAGASSGAPPAGSSETSLKKPSAAKTGTSREPAATRVKSAPAPQIPAITYD
jgi:serine/threonine-protein kinase